MVAGAADVIEDVRRDQHAHPEVVRHAADHLEHLAALDRIEAVRRLVEDDQFGRVHERLCELDALAHTERERADHARALFFQPHGKEHLRGATDGIGAREATQLGEMPHKIGGRQLGGEALVLGGVADATANAIAGGARVLAEYVDLAGIKADESEDRLHQGRLTGAVATKQPGGRRVDADRHVVKGDDLAVGASSAVHLNRGACRHAHSVRGAGGGCRPAGRQPPAEPAKS